MLPPLPVSTRPLNCLRFPDTFLKTESSASLCYHWRFGNIHYTKEGSGKPILLIHDLSPLPAVMNGKNLPDVLQRIEPSIPLTCWDLAVQKSRISPTQTIFTSSWFQILLNQKSVTAPMWRQLETPLRLLSWPAAIVRSSLTGFFWSIPNLCSPAVWFREKTARLYKFDFGSSHCRNSDLQYSLQPKKLLLRILWAAASVIPTLLIPGWLMLTMKQPIWELLQNPFMPV